MTSDVPESDAPRRKTVMWTTVGVVAVLLVVVVAVLLTRSGGSGATPGSGQTYNGSAPPTAGASAKPSQEVTTPVPSASIPKPTATGKPTVVPTQSTSTTSAPLDDTATPASGIEVQVSDVESVQGVAQGPGEIAGPAVRVSVEVKNKSDEEVAMDLALVNVYYGSDKTPATALSGPGLAPLTGSIPPGKSATGAYVFSVPEDEREQLTVEFSYSTDAPTVIFSGKA
jgi:hypothetical protein